MKELPKKSSDKKNFAVAERRKIISLFTVQVLRLHCIEGGAIKGNA